MKIGEDPRPVASDEPGVSCVKLVISDSHASWLNVVTSQLPTHVICLHPSVEVNLSLGWIGDSIQPTITHVAWSAASPDTYHYAWREGTINADWLVHWAEPPSNIFWVLDTTSWWPGVFVCLGLLSKLPVHPPLCRLRTRLQNWWWLSLEQKWIPCLNEVFLFSLHWVNHDPLDNLGRVTSERYEDPV